MEAFLQFSKESQTKLSEFEKVHVVIGNEACDLDSVVSALVYAQFLHSRQTYTNVMVIPMLNIPAVDFPLRTESKYVLSKYGINGDLLTFRDQLDLSQLHAQGRLKLTLVDFNVFRGKDSELEGDVVEVLDHHQKERQDKEGVSVTLEMVGSCCSLVAEKLTECDTFEFPVEAAGMLYNAILMDTVCLSEAAGRTTPKDTAMIVELEKVLNCDSGDRQSVFDQVQKAKMDVSGLTTDELLRRDLKVVSSDAMSVAISSIPVHIKEFLQNEKFEADLGNFCDIQKADVCIIMSMYITESGDPTRQLAVYPCNTDYSKQIVSVLLSETSLGFTSFPSPVASILAFDQGNVKASRKVILPLVRAHIETC